MHAKKVRLSETKFTTIWRSCILRHKTNKLKYRWRSTSFRLPFRLRCSSRASDSKIAGLTIGPNEQYLASNGKHAHGFVDRASACLLLKIGNPYDERDHQS